MAKGKKITKVTQREMDDLKVGIISTIYQGRVHLSCEGSGNDIRFVITGRSGTQSMLCSETSLNRLNAHWVAFAAQEANS